MPRSRARSRHFREEFAAEMHGHNCQSDLSSLTEFCFFFKKMQRHLWTEMTTGRAIEAADTFLKTRVTSRKKNERYNIFGKQWTVWRQKK